MNTMDTTITTYLNSRGATLWGRAYDIHSPDGRDTALQFIRKLWIELEDIESDLRYQTLDEGNDQ